MGPVLSKDPGRMQRLTTERGRSLVVETGLQDHEVVAVDEVDEAVLLADAAGPGACEHMPEWLGLPDARDGVAERVVDQPVDALKGGSVRGEPVGVVLPAVRGEDEPHLTRSCSSRCPATACCKLSISRLAFAGTRSKCAVSSRAS